MSVGALSPEVSGHDAPLAHAPTAVGTGQSGRTPLAVPREVLPFRSACDAQGVNGSSVPITIAVVLTLASITRCPNEYGPSSTSTLQITETLTLQRMLKLAVLANLERIKVLL